MRTESAFKGETGLLLRYVEGEFKRRYGGALRGALRWLARSIRPCGGSSAWWAPGVGWAPPYPETSGYLIPTLFETAEHLHTEWVFTAAVRMLEWLLSLQAEEGWFPAGVGRARGSPSVFNTAQILLGLLAASQRLGEERWRIAAQKAANWIAAVQEESGIWVRHNYVEGFSPSYYTRVAWPLALAGRLFGMDEATRAASRCLEAIAERMQSDWVEQMGFKPNDAAFTHTIAYTVRGFLECGRILDRKWWDAGRKMAWRLLRLTEKEGLAGAYRDNWKVAWKGMCVTGHAQVALCFLRVCEKEKDWRFLSAALKLIDAVMKVQKAVWTVSGGGLPGSWPVWGRYMRFRFPNWAAKFLIDSILEVSRWRALK